MKLHPRRPARRGGFTLVELIVVITIIALLIALLTGAIISTLNKMDEVATRHEISGLSQSQTQFQADFNLQTSPPPSRLWLDETGNYNGTNPVLLGGNGLTQAQLQQIAADSQAYLNRLWPRLNYASNNGKGIDWNGDGTPGNSSVILEGQQCLIFFLGGARSNGAFNGFSTDPANPMNPSTTKRKGPYFQFVAARVQSGPNGYPQYADPYGTTYAYFSTIKSPNNYNAYGTSDCPSLTTQVPGIGMVSILPYASAIGTNTTPTQWYKPDSFQIISAGKDQKFGPGVAASKTGAAWTPDMGAGGMNGAGMGAGVDDISNFYDSKLGTKQ